MLRLTTLGTLSLTWADGSSTALASRRRALGLLALVAATKEGVSRDSAMALLWPELDAMSARNNLKQTVFGMPFPLYGAINTVVLLVSSWTMAISK